MTAKDFQTKFFLTEDSLQAARALGKQILPELQGILDQFYDWMRTIPEFSSFFYNESHVSKVKQMQYEHWLLFWDAKIDENYISARRHIGQTHARIGLSLETYYTSVMHFNQLFEQIFSKLGITDPLAIFAFHKLVNLDVFLIVETYNNIINETIRAQNQALMEMSTPVAQLWHGILMLPLVGIIDSSRAQGIMTAMLTKIADTQSKVFILDISGVAMVDTAVANHLIKMTKAGKLMGCNCIISGISPAVAQTIVELGVQVEEVNTTGSMRDALSSAFRQMSVRIVEERGAVGLQQGF